MNSDTVGHTLYWFEMKSWSWVWKRWKSKGEARWSSVSTNWEDVLLKNQIFKTSCRLAFTKLLFVLKIQASDFHFMQRLSCVLIHSIEIITLRVGFIGSSTHNSLSVVSFTKMFCHSPLFWHLVFRKHQGLVHNEVHKTYPLPLWQWNWEAIVDVCLVTVLLCT